MAKSIDSNYGKAIVLIKYELPCRKQSYCLTYIFNKYVCKGNKESLHSFTQFDSWLTTLLRYKLCSFI